MNKTTLSTFIQTANAIIAIAFGLITIWVGGTTLLGFSNPGYVIFLPLLIFNTIMGFAYLGTGILIWQQHHKATKASKIIFGLNTLVLVIITLLYWINFDVAFNSLKAMSLRTLVWAIIYSSMAKIKR
ncbi:hypothetical protein [Fodinibius sp. AD559]|uniref:hypothetical protein n=1 Tax=Fodinibius sp. AD559 TaxID=3424179 RepID=UPI0040469585